MKELLDKQILRSSRQRTDELRRCFHQQFARDDEILNQPVIPPALSSLPEVRYKDIAKKLFETTPPPAYKSTASTVQKFDIDTDPKIVTTDPEPVEQNLYSPTEPVHTPASTLIQETLDLIRSRRRPDTVSVSLGTITTTSISSNTNYGHNRKYDFTNCFNKFNTNNGSNECY